MSKLFYDDLLDLTEIEKKIKKHVKDADARDEIYQLIDEIIHHRVLGCILDRLPKSDHKEFVNHISVRPHDKGILNFVSERVSEDVREFVQNEVYSIGSDILNIIMETQGEGKASKKSHKH